MERFETPVNPTSGLEFSQLLVEFQLEKSSPRSYLTDNGAEALRSLAIVYQIVVRRNGMQALPLNPHYRYRRGHFESCLGVVRNQVARRR
jgi:hypothetical protein